MRNIRTFLFFLAVLCSSVLYAGDTVSSSGVSNGASANVAANSGDKIEMADALKANGKIYVVVSVVLIILLGLLIYLIRIDRKVSKMEKNIEAEKKQ